jgi:N-acetyl-anhydromuramoyl-L-alanine amidase
MNANMTALEINADGVLNQATFIASPNVDDRPDGMEVKLIVIHNISLPPGQYGGNGIIELFTNQLDPAAHPYYAEIYTLKVSSHFLIRRNGSVLQFVPCGMRAWHAGVSNWQGQERCNDFSVGIELEGCDTDIFTEAQYAQLKRLIAALKQRYPITGIAGHSDIAPGRKTDPGPGFDWSKIA